MSSGAHRKAVVYNLSDEQLLEHLMNAWHWLKCHMAAGNISDAAAAFEETAELKEEALRRMRETDPVLRNGKHG